MKNESFKNYQNKNNFIGKCEKFHHVAKHLKRFISLKHIGESSNIFVTPIPNFKFIRSQSHKTCNTYIYFESKANRST